MILFFAVLIAYIAACISFVPRSREAWTNPDGTLAAYRARLGLADDSPWLLPLIRTVYIVLYMLLAVVGIVLLLTLAQIFFGGR